MITKVYRSNSILGITIRLKSGKSKHISFSALTAGGSLYYSTNKEEQEAIERHHGFGRMFRLDSAMGEPEPEKKPAAAAPALKVETPKAPAEDQKPGKPADGPVDETPADAPADEPADESEEAPAEDDGPVSTKYTSIPDAKDFLTQRFPEAESEIRKIRTKDAVKSFASAHGVTFIGLE